MHLATDPSAPHQPRLDVPFRSALQASEGDLLSHHFSLKLGRDSATQKSAILHQYTTYPYRLSRPLNLDSTDRDRLYLYLMNTSPGILAGDKLRLKLALAPQANLYFTDQAATKIHCMAKHQQASLDMQISLGAHSSLEYSPEPVILYADSDFEQTTRIDLDPTAMLCLSETILPGRIARNEWYSFRQYFSRLKIFDPSGDLLMGDAIGLKGQGNPVINSRLLTQFPVISTIILIVPNCDLGDLLARIQVAPEPCHQNVRFGYSKLPNVNGLIVRAMADQSDRLKSYIHFCLNCVRQLTHKPHLPEIPK